MRVRLTSSAAADLEAAEAYIRQDNPSAAIGVVVRILEAAATLADMPNIGRPGRVPQTRELVISSTPFIAVYRVRANTVWILRVLHGARQWPPRDS